MVFCQPIKHLCEDRHSTVTMVTLGVINIILIYIGISGTIARIRFLTTFAYIYDLLLTKKCEVIIL